MVLFVPLFALAFIIIYRPSFFDSIGVNLKEHIDLAQETITWLAAFVMTLIGMAIGALSRVIMNAYTKRHSISYLGYIVWILSEIGAMAILFTIFSLFTDTAKSMPEILRTSFVRTVLVAFIPYTVSYIYFILQDKMSELKALRQQIERDETVLQKAYIQILDEKGEMRLSIRRENLVMIESADNYVCVHYMSDQKIKKTMVRNTLNRVAEHLQGSRVVRCHRSYMINLDHAQVLHRDKEGIFIEVGIEGVPNVPISRTYAENIQEWFVGNN